MRYGHKKRTSPLSGLVRFSLTTAPLVARRSGVSRLPLRAEGRRRERHRMKDTARIVVLGRDAFLVGYRIFGGTHQILTGSYDANNREKADRNGKMFSAIASVVQNTVYRRRYRLRKVAGTAATAAALVLQNAHTENDGLNHIDHGNGIVLVQAQGVGSAQ